MERLVLKRKPVRQSFTVTYKTVLEHLSKRDLEIDEKVITFNINKLERLSSELDFLNEQIINLVLDENDEVKLDKEYEEQESYKDKLESIKIEIESLRSKHVGLEPNFNQALSSCSSPSLSKKLRLPKIELKQFGGEVRDWLSFWSQFKRIHNDKELEAEDKFQYLIQATIKGSRARDIVEGFPATGENYDKAVEVLKNRFGRDELLIEYYVRELLSLVVRNASSSISNTKLNMTQLYDKLESHLRALESIGVTRTKYEAMLFPLVESCIPEDILRAWLRCPSSKVVLQDDSGAESFVSNNRLQHLLSFLKSEVEGEERISMARAGFKGFDQQIKEKKYRSSECNGCLPMTASNLFSGEKCLTDKSHLTSNNKYLCVFCDKTHESRDCFTAQKMSMSQKREILSKKKACFLCLKVGHQSKFCKSSVKCIVCGKKHLTIMCPNLVSNETKSKPNENNKVENTDRLDLKGNESHSTNLTSQSTFNDQLVLLQTLQVNVGQRSSGKTRTVRALIDSGSQRSYILERTVDELGCTPLGEKELVHTLFGGLNSKKKVHRCYDLLVSSLIRDYTCNMTVLDQPTICSLLPRLTYGPWIEEMKSENIMLTDFGECQSEIELLIGADMLGNLLTGQTYKLSCGLVAVQTLLGWTVMGKWPATVSAGKHITDSYGALVTSLFIQTDQIPDLWSLDVLGIKDPYEIKTKEENEFAALQYFKDTVKVNTDGRYEVRLPWVENQENLASNKDIAQNRLKSTTVKLLKENKFEDYDNVLNLWESAGIIEKVQDEVASSNTGYFLPHRAVIKEQSTTKIRPVFDASSKSKGAFSLNDCLEKGPNFIDLIPSILMRFRKGNIGVTSDIEKAFLQISVNKSDCDYLKFLWWDNYKENIIKVYRHCRVVFGVNCSPFLLGATILHHLDSSSSQFPTTSKKLKKSFYVDNCVTSVDTEGELHQFVEESRVLMSNAKFPLRDWRSSIDPVKEEHPVGVLGLLWDTSKDELYYKIPFIELQGSITRRNILSIVQQIFDPIGVLCPVLLYPKMLLQESWKIKLSWDSTVPQDIENKFFKWLGGLKSLSEVRIMRQCTLKSVLKQSFSLHIFCDASKLAYSAVVFLRSELEGNVNVQLLMAKSRIAPLKPMSIPRLELMACTIGARLGKTVSDSLDITNLRCYYWSDSTTALYWIKHDEPWGTFVYNRVKEIRCISEYWLHIPGHLNPADLPSRGCTAVKLLSSLWWEGPSWLKLKEEQWPKGDLGSSKNDAYLERKKNVETTLLTSSKANNEWYLAYFSKYSKILRMVAWILRFLCNVRKRSDERLTGELTVSEITSAEKVVLKQVQNDVFRGVNKSILKNLCTFEDTDGLLRVKTKIFSSKSEDFDFKCPILLPTNHQIVRLMIQQQHNTLSHAGVNVLMSKLREQFWILQGRKSIRSVISKCVQCRRFAAKPIMMDPVCLPEDRVRDAAVFEVVGIDLAGPLYLKDGSKAWITVYTCAVYRAIHLELITSLSTNGFLLGFRRFVARRGRPKTVYSDNGTNFIGADNLFKSIDWSFIERECSVSKVQWKFIPPTAAWWGGWWERIVQMVKNLLRRILGRALLSYEELSSILCDCESVINSRPLTYISEEPDGIAPLTPKMFLQDNLETGVPDLDFIHSKSLTKRLRHQQNLRNQFRKRFRSEYLSQLVLKPKKGDTNEGIKENDIVIVGNDNNKRINWPLARVIKVYPGKDGVTRVVKLKTETTELIRPVQRLFPLEVSGPAVEELEKEDNMSEPQTPKPKPLLVNSRGRLIKLPKKLNDYKL